MNQMLTQSVNFSSPTKAAFELKGGHGYPGVATPKLTSGELYRNNTLSFERWPWPT